MPSWDRLAEARIQEWLRRPAKDEVPAASHVGGVEPLELQLLEEALALLTEARECRDESRAGQLRVRAEALQTRLLVVLESSGRPLAAQHFAKLLNEAR